MKPVHDALQKADLIDIFYEYSQVSTQELQALSRLAQHCFQSLQDKNCRGAGMTGWLDAPSKMHLQLPSIQAAAQDIRDQGDLVVIGIGGSYLGTRAIEQALSDPFAKRDGASTLWYAGHNLSSSYLQALLRHLQTRDFSINVVSKSGTTTEPAIAFRILYKLLQERYGEKAHKRVFATTDPHQGALRELAKAQGFASFAVPADMGGRYSLFSPVSLLPLAAAGIEIEALLQGALAMRAQILADPLSQQGPLAYAAFRQLMVQRGKTVELFTQIEPGLGMFTEWLRQLFAESEGKEGKGLFPGSALFTTDLHSIGQMIQEGKPLLFETVLEPLTFGDGLSVPKSALGADELDYLEGKSLDSINREALRASLKAHFEGDTPSLRIGFGKLDAYHLGALVYFFQVACAVSALLSGVNPFDQPGVEAYKTGMFQRLGKPGYETACR